MSDEVEQTRREVKRHLQIGGSLVVLILVSVGFALLPLGHAVHLVIGLLIAVLMASLVLVFFMHLKMEKPLVHLTLVAAAFFFLALILLTLLAFWDYTGTAVVSKF